MTPEPCLACSLVRARAQVRTSCARVTDANKAFDAAELRTFADGGLYAEVGPLKSLNQVSRSGVAGATVTEHVIEVAFGIVGSRMFLHHLVSALLTACARLHQLATAPGGQPCTAG